MDDTMKEGTKKDIQYMLERQNNPLANQNDPKATEIFNRLQWVNLNGLTNEERRLLFQATSSR